MSETVLASHDDYLITGYETGKKTSDTLVITFGGQPSKRTSKGFGTDWCLAQGFDTIYVAQRAHTQYQDLPLAAFLEAVAPVAEGREVVCYGSSLGGYAALYYGGPMNARIIAAAPTLPAWPALKRRPYLIPIQHAPLTENGLSQRAPVVIYDPHLRNDRIIMDDIVLPAYPDTRIVEVEYGGHAVLKTLAEANQVSAFIKALLREDKILPLQMPTDTSPIWLFHRGRAIRSSDPDLAQSYFEKSLAIQRNQHVLGTLVEHLLRNNKLDEAARHISAAAASGDRKQRIASSILDRARALGIDVPEAA